MSITNPVLYSTKRVVDRAKNVTINGEKLKKVAEEWAKMQVSPPAWPEDFHLRTKDVRQLLDYIIVLDSLNFCFWSENDEDKWHIDYDGEKYSGYFALSLALKRFFESYPKKATFEYLQNITFAEFSQMLAGEGKLLFLKKRYEILSSVAKAMVEEYSGNSERLVLSGSHLASKFVPLVAKNLPSFNDEAEYDGKKVYFWKRAQILASDIHGATSGRGIGYFEDLDYLAAFADYKLSQILNYWGILEYSPKLNEKIKDKVLIKAGSKEEVEIRSATVWAVEYLKEELERRGRRMRSFEIDWLLWNESKRVQMTKPHHLTQTIFY
ncbi:hypothetical protein A3H53_01200 [Candidatus Nomurabacteria bacterium RIFCSPLOWO2_02_FULL_40_10]|uniref:Queuosine 5'-phosphate N-glycosylase/hydrolase n=1 Tax=Candidatus Nomurabacteria bacterium RIFCSPLOWO2_02_FULL_40_10 TaxID=1801786 RepID=A0A1F6XWV3_9BACT|nr:MAG: hypothetical protein A3H53_01200 [Candidatus Nomurabacteria bacterium RIFCSPLOWO2_02_FULL_40_10]